MKGRTYRYMTEEPLYPFGYGLSYTDFEIVPTQIVAGPDAYRSVDGKLDDRHIYFKSGSDSIDITVKVSNKGSMAGAVTVQAYVDYTALNVKEAPIRQLKGLKKVHLDAGEEKEVVPFFSGSEPKNYSGYNMGICLLRMFACFCVILSGNWEINVATTGAL